VYKEAEVDFCCEIYDDGFLTVLGGIHHPNDKDFSHVGRIYQRTVKTHCGANRAILFGVLDGCLSRGSKGIRSVASMSKIACKHDTEETL
jgi:hypothetical protein